MIRISVVSVGKLNRPYFRAACAEYEKRLGGMCRFFMNEVDEARVPDKASEAEISLALNEEGKRLLSSCDSGAVKIALCIEGKLMSSPELARYFERYAISGAGNFSLLIGGSWGLSEQVKAASALCLSFSPMTFPHQLARVMACEQIYRAMSILAGNRYHK